MTQSEDFAKAIAFAWWPIFKMLSFLEYWLFFRAFFAQNNSKWFVEWIFDMFFGILIFDPKWGFCKGYSLCMMADVQNGLISRILIVFSSGFFAQNNSKLICRMDSDMFFGIFLSEDFAKASFAWWSISKMVSFLQY